MSDMAFDSDFTQMIENASPEQREQIMQLLNPDQQALALPYQFSRPGNVGDIFRNIGSNLVNRAAVKYGIRPDPQQVLANQQYLSNALDLAITERDLQREQGLRQFLTDNTSLDKAFIETASAETLEEAYSSLVGEPELIPGVGFGQRNLNTNQLTMLNKSPAALQEYDYSVRQIKEQNKGVVSPMRSIPIPTFDEWQKNKKLMETNPAAVNTFEYLRKLNPDIDRMEPAEQQALLMQIMRQGRDVDYEYLVSRAKQTAKAGGIEDLTPGELKLDETFGKILADYNSMGGMAEHRRIISELNGVTKRLLREPRDGSSSLSGRIVAASPDIAKNAEAINIQDQIGRIVTKDLRATLGPQFTEAEGQRFVAYAYNIMLPPHVNALRLARLRSTMEEAAREKNNRINYFKENGTLKGHKGRDYFAEDFYESVFKPEDYDGLTDNEVLQLFERAVQEDSLDEEFEVLVEVLKQRDLNGYGVE